MFTSSKMSEASRRPHRTLAMRERAAERNGARRVVVDSRRRDLSDHLPVPGEPPAFPFESGGSYVGEWRRDRKEGFGKQNWSDGRLYEGEWRDGQRHGKGSLWTRSGGKLVKNYAGDWDRGRKSGLGVQRYANGDAYEGEYAAGERHGTGSMRYADGGTYEGGWARNKRSGLGVYEAANGDRFEGHWCDGVKEGPGRYFYASTGKIYEGEWVDGAPRCGSFRDATPEEANGTLPSADEQFSLPALSLLEPEALLAKRVAELRQLRANATEDVVRAFSEDELAVLRHVFTLEDKQKAGLVPAVRVGYLLERCRLPVDAVSVERLLGELGADDDTRVTLAEFVDMAALLMSA